MKKHLMRCLAVACVVALLFTLSGIPGLAYAGPKAPESPDCTWMTTGTVVSIAQNKDTFVINAPIDRDTSVENGSGFGDIDVNVGDLFGFAYDIKMYITFPVEGGFRLRLSEKASESGFFNPSALSDITYTTLGDGRIMMYGTGDTVLYYQETETGFTIAVGDKQGNISLAFTDDDMYLGYKNHKIVRTKMRLPLHTGEAIYNGSERFNDVNQVGYSFSLRNVDAAYHGSTTASSTHTDSYINVPIFHSSEGYSVWYNMTYTGTADIGSTDVSSYTVDFDGGKFDFYMWNGTILENIKKYTAITGTSIVPPKWAFGYWLGAQAVPWRTDQTTGKSYADGSAEAIQMAYDNLVAMYEGYEAMGITDIAAVYGEGLNSTTNAAAYEYVNSRGSRMLMWYTPQGYSTVSHMPTLLPGVARNDWPLPLNLANPVPGNFFTSGEERGFMDFSHPNAVSAITSFFNGGTSISKGLKYWNLGLKGAMIDYGEWLRDDTLLYNGLKGDEMHNFVSYYYAKAQQEAWHNYYPDDDYILFQRSGTAGSQRYVANFTGDQKASWEGLKDQIHGILSMSTAGFNIVGGDMGGFSGQPSQELYTRWVEFSTFSPLMRTHGSIKNPWDKGGVAKNSFPTYYWLRMNMQDLLYSAAVDANKNATPMVMPLGVAYQGQKGVKNINDQYLFCNSFLVNPITSADTYERELWLPEGNWYDFWNYQRVEGNRKITAEAPTATIPVYLKSGAAVAVELPDTMLPTDSMEGKTKYKGLLITPADNLTSTPVYTSAEAAPTVYTSRYISTNAYRLTASEGSERRMLVAYGTNATAVLVDDVELTKLDHMPNIAANENGYYVDGEGRTFILAPNAWKDVKITYTHSYINSKEVGLTVDGSTSLDKAVDGDLNTHYAIPAISTLTFTNGASTDTTQAATFEFSFRYPMDVREVVVNWDEGNYRYATSYKVQLQDETDVWRTVATVTNGTAGRNFVFTIPEELKGVVWKNIRLIDLVAAPKGTNESASADTNVVKLAGLKVVRDFQQPIEFTLDKTSFVNEIALYWGKFAMVDYTLSVSENGSEWETVKVQKDGMGAVERVRFETPKKIAYIRLSNMGLCTKDTAPYLREVKCFAADAGTISRDTFTSSVTGLLGYGTTAEGIYPNGEGYIEYGDSSLTTEQNNEFKNYMEGKFAFAYNNYSNAYSNTLKATGNSSYVNFSGVYANAYLQFKYKNTYSGTVLNNVASLVPKDASGNKMVAQDFTVKLQARFESASNGALVIGFHQAQPGRFYNGYGSSALITGQGYIKISPNDIEVYNGNESKTVVTRSFGDGIVASNENFKNTWITVSVKDGYLHYSVTPEKDRIASASGSVKLETLGEGYISIGVAQRSVSLRLPTIQISKQTDAPFVSSVDGLLGYNTTVAGRYPDGQPYGSYSSAQISTSLKSEAKHYLDSKYDFYYTDFASGSRTYVQNTVRTASKGWTLSAIYANQFLQMSTTNGGVAALESTELRQLTALVPKDSSGVPITLKNFKATFDIRFEKTYGAIVFGFRQATPAGFFTASGVNAAQSYLKVSPNDIILYDRGTTTVLHTFTGAKPKDTAYDQDFRVTVTVSNGTFAYTVKPLNAKATVTAVEGKARIADVGTGYMALAMACAYNGFGLLNVEPLDESVEAGYPLITTDKAVQNGKFNVTRVSEIDKDGYYQYNLTVSADDGYELKAGSLLVTDSTGSVQVPKNSTFQTNGQGKTFTFKAKGDAQITGLFCRPNKTIVNAAVVGTSYNAEKGGLRFVYRIQRKVEDGKELIRLDDAWHEVIDYGLLVAVDHVVGDQRLDVELAQTNEYVQMHSAKQNNRYYDSTDEYVDISMQITNMHTSAERRKLDMVTNAYIQLADGTYLYANGYTTNYTAAGGPDA